MTNIKNIMARILYIEDTENNRILVTRMFTRQGHQVVTAADAESGIAAARMERPNLILMDMGLPGINGWDATRKLKADPELSAIPVIALTAHAMAGDREKSLQAGCDEYDTKPYDFPRLLGKVEKLLEQSRD
jgi:two-component system cell cycle response regulator DivK